MIRKIIIIGISFIVELVIGILAAISKEIGLFIITQSSAAITLFICYIIDKMLGGKE